MKRWTIQKLVAAGALGVITTLVSLPGSFISVTLGVPGAGAVSNAFILPLSFIFALLLINKFGSATIVGAVYGFLILPMPIGGLPGFLPKTILWITVGLVSDIIWALLKVKERVKVLITCGVGTIVGLLLFTSTLVIFNIPGGEVFIDLIKKPFILPILAIWGMVGGYFGRIIYNKIKKTSIVKRIQK